jgi:hypothetical protein
MTTRIAQSTLRCFELRTVRSRTGLVEVFVAADEIVVASIESIQRVRTVRAFVNYCRFSLSDGLDGRPSKIDHSAVGRIRTGIYTTLWSDMARRQLLTCSWPTGA